ncbi:MAG: hypothetical protein NZ473_04640, partial [Candidatus Kapabacteria bacterium]|nr:hypothetical protein [Candidatus Kapabacteria bacterium]MDW8225092.1 hypothetical protein [Bacteroidota bacterium]
SGVFVDEGLLHPTAEDKESTGWALEEILGCTVLEEVTERQLGTVVDVWLLPANDVWVVESETGYLPLPAIADAVRRVDVQQRRIWVHLLPGLLDIVELKSGSDSAIFVDEEADAD